MGYDNPKVELAGDDVTSPEQDSGTSASHEKELTYTELKDMYFVFIDVLGFKDTFDEIKLSGNNQFAHKYKDAFNYFFELMNAAVFTTPGEDKFYYAGQTSDSLYFYTKNPIILLDFLKIYAHFSLWAMSNNVFFRGGISKGNLYYKEKYQFYGDCVIGAYSLENEISSNPIITIDTKTHKDMINEPEYEDLVGEKNHRYYLKPFQYLLSNFSLSIDQSACKIREISIEIIKRHINKNLERFEFSAKNYSKYVYLLEEYEKTLNDNKAESIK